MGEDEIDKRILEATSKWNTPFEAGSEQKAKDKLMSLARENSTSQDYSWMRVAASFAIIIMIPVALMFLGKTEVSNKEGATLAYSFPCGSEVTLNEGASITFNKYFWSIYRKVEFEGEAYFSVEEGSKFVVDAEAGDIEVLGTEFTIWADNNDLFAHCTEGEVKVISDLEKEVLQSGEFTKVDGSRLDPVQKIELKEAYFPGNSSDILKYEEMPIGLVIAEMELALNMEIEHSLDASLLYTGELNTAELDSCLEIFCKPFNANFVKEEGLVSIHP